MIDGQPTQARQQPVAAARDVTAGADRVAAARGQRLVEAVEQATIGRPVLAARLDEKRAPRRIPADPAHRGHVDDGLRRPVVDEVLVAVPAGHDLDVARVPGDGLADLGNGLFVVLGDVDCLEARREPAPVEALPVAEDDRARTDDC